MSDDVIKIDDDNILVDEAAIPYNRQDLERDIANLTRKRDRIGIEIAKKQVILTKFK